MLEQAKACQFCGALDAFRRIPLHQSGQVRWIFLVKRGVLEELVDQGFRTQATRQPV